MAHLLRVTAALVLSCALHPSLSAQDYTAVAPVDVGKGAGDFDDYDDYDTVEVYDPLEGFHRRIFAFNDWTYTNVLSPAVKGYEFVVRPPLNRAIGHFYDNVRYPVRLVNSLLQGKFSRADLETRKFVVNTLGGLGGFIRQTDKIPELASVPREDFGQTLGVWGVPHGPYLVVPIFGGLSLRDLGGRAADSVVSPTGWEYIDLANREWIDALDWEWQTAITVTDTMSSLPSGLNAYQQMKESAVDPYLSVRDATRRFRDRQTRQ